MAFSELPTPPRPSDVGPGSPHQHVKGPWKTLLGYVPFVLSALWAAVILRLLVRDIRYILPLLVLGAVWALPLYFIHRKQRAALVRGNVPDVLQAWTPMLERTPYPETTQPILMATAYAANGWTEAAREAMGRAHRGAAFDAAREQRLVVEILCEAFDGNRLRALSAADELWSMPLPDAGVFLKRRIMLLRHGLAAIARAFSHKTVDRDRSVLLQARKASPLFHWAFTYAAAIAAIDEGDAAAARALLTGAPEWSPSSVFAEFQKEIVTEIARVEAIKNA